MLKRLPLWLLLLALLMPAAAKPAEVDVAAQLRTAHDLVARSLLEYRHGDTEAAFRTARSAYLDHFEYAEPPLRVLNPDLILDTEYAFANLRHGMEDGVPMSQLEATAGSIYDLLHEAESIVSGTGVLAPTLVATSSFFILFREGLEVVLLLAAILSYLQATRNGRLSRGVWLGAAAAIAATAATWFVATFLIHIAPASRELISGITSVVAVLILFYLSFWMLQQTSRRRHMEYMRARLAHAVQQGSLWAVGLAAFASVYREGFETVLLYQALLAVSGPVMNYLYLGLALAAVALLAVAFVILRLKERLPLQLFFRIAVGVTALLAVAFVGNAARALQEAGLLPISNLIGVMPRLNPNLASLTGIHPTVETLAAQGGLALIYLAGLAWLYLRGRAARTEPTSGASPAD
ncbi:MAG TPA: FTR1 family protein [Trueperaceae bacterium]